MKISLITVGKIKEKYLKDAIGEYSKRLSAYCDINIIELQDEKTPDRAPAAVEEKIKETEGSRILQKIGDRAYVIALAINGDMLSSEELAEKMSDLMVGGTRISCLLSEDLWGFHRRFSRERIISLVSAG